MGVSGSLRIGSNDVDVQKKKNKIVEKSLKG